MMDKVLDKSNLAKAFDAVKRNKGAAGIDNRSIEETRQHLKLHWQQIEDKLRSRQYRPSAVKGTYIPKGSGRERLLGIPTVQDRIIQQAIQQQLSLIFDPTFSEHSYGFRPYRKAHDAVKSAQQFVKTGKKWVVDLDIEAFFDHVNHDILMNRIKKDVGDKNLLFLINRYLKSGIIINGQWQATVKGTPQGSPLSPLLANIYLDKLDKELEKRNLSFCRYADDTNIYVKSERSAQRVFQSIANWTEKHLKLKVNMDKSGIGKPGERQFLGFRITSDMKLMIDPKRVERYKTKVRMLWDARQSLTSRDLIKQWRRYIVGWINYFKITETPFQLKQWSGWTRRHMRKCFWLRWHNQKGRYNALKKLGIKGRSLKISCSSRGAWRIAASYVLHRALKNVTLRKYGLWVPTDFLITESS